ncbi:MAG: hypothetical protein B7Y35_06140 [Sphingomonadales bacterium 28-64-96]|nr:MAG: hypothetical protein B7Y35_06140 [Sphingomonadales bacterium 28-64-96]
MFRLMLARFGLAPPPFTAAALDVQGMLRDLENHLVLAKDRQGVLLAQRLHHRLWQVVSHEAPPGAVDLAPLSATPKPPRD